MLRIIYIIIINMKKTELLAPAKDKQTAIAAINSGADAVYIGAAVFGARQAAGNSLEDIKEVVEFAHKFYVKVHVTINTILSDKEILQAKELIKKLYEIGVDAIIVQDMGILELAIRGELPPIPIHASTQCDNRTAEKVKFFDDVGLSRVILARELSIEEIKNIHNSVNCEIESFVHGALCVSYSGQCYLSASIGGRSANRGECAQPCRKKYTIIDENGKILSKDKYLLSLKDFNASEQLEKLVDAGVKSFKIEGRLKDENYVKNVVAFYRQQLDKFSEKTSSGKVFLDFTPDVKKSFNRGFTEYFLTGRENCFNFESPKSRGEYLGKVTKTGHGWFEIDAELSPQDGLCFGEKGCLVNKIEGKRVYPNNMDGLTPGTPIYRNFDAKFDKLLKNSKLKRQIGIDFNYKNGILTVTDEDGNCSASLINGETPKNPDKMTKTFIEQLKKTGESDFYVKDIKISGEIPFLPVSSVNSIRREILDNLLKERLKNYRHEIQKTLKYARYPQSEIDYRGNVNNSFAETFYKNCGCTVTAPAFEKIRPQNATLMQTKHCLKYALGICKSPGKLYLIDEKGKKYALEFDCKNCMMLIKDFNSNT